MPQLSPMSWMKISVLILSFSYLLKILNSNPNNKSLNSIKSISNKMINWNW